MRSRLALSFCCIAFALVSLVRVAAREMSPPKGAEIKTVQADTVEHRDHKTVNVLFLKSWGVTSVWEDLKTNWSNYGKIPLSIDDTTYIDSDFTYQDLVNSKANVLVLSNPSGGTQQYTTAEFAAVSKYAKKGHPVIGTYLVFQWGDADNRALAPVFGLRSGIEYNTTEVAISNDFTKVKQNQCLLKKISGKSWESAGYPYTEVPASGNWKGNLGKSKAIAQSDKYVGVITTYTTKQYTGVFISNFAEYNGNTDDEQLLYNASTCYVK